jgi:hypothetical protein
MKYIITVFCLFFALPVYSHKHAPLLEYPAGLLRDWGKKKHAILKPTERKPSRTAVLIIAPPVMGNCYTENRWKLGKKAWEQYMNTVPNVDCYFIQSTYPRKGYSEQVWLEGNTLYVGDWWYEKYGNDRILYKTIVAIENLLPNYTHFIRTNLNTFFNLKAVREYVETHHQSMYTGPLWEKQWYVLGYGILFTADVATHIVNEYRRLEDLDVVSCYRADDCVLTALATGVYPFNHSEHAFRCCFTLPLGIRQLMSTQSLSTKRLSRYGVLLCPPVSFEQTIKYCEQASSSVMLYRIREGFELDKLAEFYEYLLHKIYPELPYVDLLKQIY